MARCTETEIGMEGSVAVATETEIGVEGSVAADPSRVSATWLGLGLGLGLG